MLLRIQHKQSVQSAHKHKGAKGNEEQGWKDMNKLAHSSDTRDPSQKERFHLTNQEDTKDGGHRTGTKDVDTRCKR